MNEHLHFSIGNRFVWGGEVQFGLSNFDLRHHVRIAGQTGTGKSTLIKNLAMQLIEAGCSIALIDPHGDLCDELLNRFPPARTDHLIYFDPSDLSHSVGLNLLTSPHTDDRHRVASGIVAAFRAIWQESWGPRLEWILYASLAALLECQNVTLLGLPRMLVDDTYRAWVLRQVKDPVIRSFFFNEFDAWDERFRREAIAPVQNKLGQFLAAPALRNALGQVANRVDARFIMDHGRVFIANLSRGKLGEDKSNLLGALLVAQFHQAAMSRADIPEHERRDFVLICDEFASYANQVVGRGLSELRKYRASLVLATQYLNQVPDEVQDALSGNCGTHICFRLGEADAHVMSREFGDFYPASAFSDLANFEILVKKLSNGIIAEPFRGTTLGPLGRAHGRREHLIHHSRERYATPRTIVEERILRWMGESRPAHKPEKANRRRMDSANTK